MSKEIITIDWQLLNDISYQTNLGKSLKNTLRKFNKEELFDELNEMIAHFTECATNDILKHENRVKSLQSCAVKYERFFPSKEVEKTFNDILGLRVVVDTYNVLDEIAFPGSTNIADMRSGKAFDDGYRGVHVYYQKDHFHYPIEIQFVTSFDRQFNEWLHIYVYKYVNELSVGATLRKRYEQKLIVTEEDFRKELRDVLSSCEKV